MLLEADKPITLAGLKPLCMKWLFTGLVSALVIGPQPGMPSIVGQMIVLLNDLAAVVIILSTFRSKWPLGLIACIILAKMISIIFAISGAGIAYVIFVNIMLCIAGVVIAFERSDVVYKQLMVMCLISVPFMIMQSAGFGGFAQLLSTNYYDHITAPDVQNTLFTPLSKIIYDVKVFRPSGLFRTGTLVSLVVLFALPFHLSRVRGRFPGGTAILCAMAVLSMGKGVLLGSIILVLFFLFKGNSRQRHESVKTVIFMLFFLYLYSFFFPGLFNHNLGKSTRNYSLSVRLHDIVETFPEEGIVRRMVSPHLKGTFRAVHLKEGEHLSGIPSLLVT